MQLDQIPMWKRRATTKDGKCRTDRWIIRNESLARQMKNKRLQFGSFVLLESEFGILTPL